MLCIDSLGDLAVSDGLEQRVKMHVGLDLDGSVGAGRAEEHDERVEQARPVLGRGDRRRDAVHLP